VVGPRVPSSVALARRPSRGKIENGAPIRCYDHEMNTLNIKAFGGLLLLLLVMAALLFIAAGTLDYWEAWTFLAVYFAPSVAITLYLMKEDPKLLERRMRGARLPRRRRTKES